jgi:hypothetical protein
MHADLANYHSSRCARIRRMCEDANHHPPRAKHSTHPVPLDSAGGLIPSLSDFMGSSLTSSCFGSALPDVAMALKHYALAQAKPIEFYALNCANGHNPY